MNITNFYQPQQMNPEASANTSFWLQHQKFTDELLAKREAEEQGREAARAFTAAFEKELEKLFK